MDLELGVGGQKKPNIFHLANAQHGDRRRRHKEGVRGCGSSTLSFHLPVSLSSRGILGFATKMLNDWADCSAALGPGFLPRQV